MHDIYAVYALRAELLLSRVCSYLSRVRQKIIVSKNWGFTPLRREEYIAKRQEGKVRVDGAYVQFLRNKGPLEYNMRRFPEAFNAETEA